MYLLVCTLPYLRFSRPLVQAYVQDAKMNSIYFRPYAADNVFAGFLLQLQLVAVGVCSDCALSASGSAPGALHDAVLPLGVFFFGHGHDGGVEVARGLGRIGREGRLERLTQPVAGNLDVRGRRRQHIDDGGGRRP